MRGLPSIDAHILLIMYNVEITSVAQRQFGNMGIVHLKEPKGPLGIKVKILENAKTKCPSKKTITPKKKFTTDYLVTADFHIYLPMKTCSQIFYPRQSYIEMISVDSIRLVSMLPKL